ncbi:hypothetical protein LCGC14_1963350 [marine sediment metagenome]|uniref:DnaB/C C-terminal domain-containing protein n=1 Tax=marine sediment metagenome TaxID=412755 RepID=A0A0F9FE95_9ZZZZ
MARARLVSKKISESERVNDLPGDGALLYTWMITHTDKYGRMKAMPLLIKNTVFPLRNVTLKNIKLWLNLMEASKKDGLGLIERYEVDDKHYLYMPGFDSEQSPQGGYKWRDNEKIDSGIPAPPDLIPPSGPKLDKPLGEVATCYADNIGNLTPIISEAIKDLNDEYGSARCIEAIKESAKKGVHNIKYITAILEGRGREPPKKAATGESAFDKIVTGGDK